ncbi:cascarilladiene synthase [Artemisia annua]|uniref:Cascarilladiene synthase n=1 Tax=Artemisia annua TaxID=35608 RepID=A0A2U1LWW4_ARTAN|nr:cascarilladiene synthase [Artemisia annua]
MVTSTYNVLVKTGLVGMGEVVTEEALAWHESHPKILQASELIAKIHNDVASYKFERKRAPGATSIDAYVKTFGVPEHVAVDELEKMIENTWKDIN